MIVIILNTKTSKAKLYLNCLFSVYRMSIPEENMLHENSWLKILEACKFKLPLPSKRYCIKFHQRVLGACACYHLQYCSWQEDD